MTSYSHRNIRRFPLITFTRVAAKKSFTRDAFPRIAFLQREIWRQRLDLDTSTSPPSPFFSDFLLLTTCALPTVVTTSFLDSLATPHHPTQTSSTSATQPLRLRFTSSRAGSHDGRHRHQRRRLLRTALCAVCVMETGQEIERWYLQRRRLDRCGHRQSGARECVSEEQRTTCESRTR